MSSTEHEQTSDDVATRPTLEPGLDDSSLVVNRWRRFGKDRLYINRGDTQVGWWDLATDEPHPVTFQDLEVLTEAVADWKVKTSRAALEVAPPPPSECADESATGPSGVAQPPGDTAVPAEGPLDGSAERPWIDLATNHAGAAAREQAVAAKDAAPVRTVLARALGVHTNERAWRIGADGEEKVATQLAKVVKKDPRWRVIHAIPVGTRGSDIDHLIIGPGGVFTANAKHHPRAKIWVGGNTFLVNGTKHPYIRNSRHEAARATDLLSDACGFSVHVEGVVIAVNAADIVVKSQPDGVCVVPRMQVARWLLRHGDILEQSTIDSIYAVARRSTTWRP